MVSSTLNKILKKMTLIRVGTIFSIIVGIFVILSILHFFNDLPVVKSLTPTGDQDLREILESPQKAGVIITWTVEAIDQEGDPVTYKFLVDGKAVTDWTSINQWTWFTSESDVGLHQIEIQVRDGEHIGGYNSNTIQFEIVETPNQKPVLLSISHRPTYSEEGDTVTWVADAYDCDDHTIYYKFFLNDQEKTSWSEDRTWTWETAGWASGQYQITVWARDGHHADEGGFDAALDVLFELAGQEAKVEKVEEDDEKIDVIITRYADKYICLDLTNPPF